MHLTGEKILVSWFIKNICPSARLPWVTPADQAHWPSWPLGHFAVRGTVSVMSWMPTHKCWLSCTGHFWFIWIIDGKWKGFCYAPTITAGFELTSWIYCFKRQMSHCSCKLRNSKKTMGTRVHTVWLQAKTFREHGETNNSMHITPPVIKLWASDCSQWYVYA